jgi:predicted nucleotidyltransferase
VKNTVAIYPGRFQPFSKHHADAFEWLKSKFKQDSYIATTGKVELPDSPLSFSEKEMVINKFGYGPNLVQVKSPYNAEEITSKYNPEETAVVYMVGEKDMKENPRFKIGKKKDGSDSYFQDYEANKNNLKGYKEHGYLIVAPHVSHNIPGIGEMSGTNVRKALSSNVSEKEYKNMFNSIFGWKEYDKEVADMLKDKFKNSSKMLKENKMILETLLKMLIKEGGNVFSSTNPTASIKKEDIDPTMEKFVDELSVIFPAKANSFKVFERLGSVGKKPISGDIDLAYDVKNIFPDGKTPDFKGWGVDKAQYEELVEGFKKRSKTASPEKIQLRAMIELIGQKIKEEGGDMEVDTKGSGSGTIFFNIPQYDTKGKSLNKNVQTDINIGNLEWLKFSYYSNTYAGNVKGLHRTQLMLATFVENGLKFLHGEGVFDKETSEKVASTPEEAIKVLNKRSGIKFTKDVLNDYFQLEEFLKNNLPEEKYNSILDRYLKILDSTRADIPENLQQYWINNQERLGLKGQYLPDDSKLKSKKKLNESGSAGGNRIERSDVEKTKDSYIKKVLSKYKGFKDAKISGSYNTGGKNDFGDIDLIVTLEGNDKKKAKDELANFVKSLPDDVIVPFKSQKYGGKKALVTGEIVTILYPIEGKPDQFIQIDNMVSTSEEESNFKKEFLDYPADVQGLMLGLIKIILIEKDNNQIFKALGISDIPELQKDEEYEFNLSSSGLTLRKVKLTPDKKEISREDIWKTTSWSSIKTLLDGFDYEKGFEPLLDQISKLSDRSKRRIKGVFNSMVSIKSGEVGTPKGENKQKSIDKVNSKL